MTAVAGAFLGVVVLAAAWRGRPRPSRLRSLLDAVEPRTMPRLAARRAWRPIVGGALGVTGMVLWPPLLVAVAGGYLAWPYFAARRDRHRTRDQVRRGLADTLDLLAIAIRAGCTVPLAVGVLASGAAEPFRSAFVDVEWRTSRGARLADALGALVERLGEPVRPLMATLVASERYGVPLGPTVEQLALDARRERRQAAELAARKLPVRLSFPLVGCILPAFALLTLAPLLAGALTSLHV